MVHSDALMDTEAVEIIDPGKGKWAHYILTAWENTWPLLCLFVLWELLARSGIIHEALFPTVTQVAQTIVHIFNEGILMKDIIASLTRVLIGGFIACLIGTVFGLIMGTNRFAEKIIVPPLNFFLSIPGIATFPIVILFLGLTETTLIVTLGFEAGLTVLVNTWMGVKSVPPNMLYAGRVLGARGWPFFRRVLFPAALPSIITGYRLGFSGPGGSWLEANCSFPSGRDSATGYFWPRIFSRLTSCMQAYCLSACSASCSSASCFVRWKFLRFSVGG